MFYTVHRTAKETIIIAENILVFKEDERHVGCASGPHTGQASAHQLSLKTRVW